MNTDKTIRVHERSFAAIQFYPCASVSIRGQKTQPPDSGMMMLRDLGIVPRIIAQIGGGTLACLPASLSLAQDSHRTIVGQVTHSTHAVVPSAVVRAIRTATNQSIETKTHSSRYYSLPVLPPGSSTTAALAQGFH